MSVTGPILTVNAGSSSLRLDAFESGGLKRVASQRADPGEDDRPLRDFLQRHAISGVECVAHRVVHGGQYTQPMRIDAQVEREIERLSPFAPLHNPFALRGIRDCRRLLAGVPQVAVFDTSFFAALPEVARTYALPRELTEQGLHRYGFHGIAHSSMWRSWQALPGVPAPGRVISLQLGAGCSAAAVRDGAALDTSMGFSPLEGLMMATRCGDLDPGLALYLQREAGYSVERLDELLNTRSGLAGVSGRSADMRELLAAQDQASALAVALYCYRVRKYVGAYLAVLGGADAVLFGGGVGENAWQVRERILAGMEWAGIALDAKANRAAAGTQARVSGPHSPVAVWVMPVDEARILAEEASRLEGLDHA